MPVTNDSGIHRITADLAKARQKIVDMESGRVGVLHPTPEDRETPEQFQARNPHAGRAFENQLNARRADVARLEREFLDAMIAAGLWPVSTIISAMTIACGRPV